jgi:thiamine biosynthesis lipoprotein ApbE
MPRTTKVSERQPGAVLGGVGRACIPGNRPEINDFLRLVLPLCLAGACRFGTHVPTVTRAESVMDGVFSVAAWGGDSARLARAVDRAFATIRQADRAQGERTGILDSLRRKVALRTGLKVDSARAVQGRALDRALDVLRGPADSAILTFGGQYLILATGSRRVGIADPDNSLEILAWLTVPPGTWSVSTLSLAEQSDPVIDPRTGKPADRVRAVTVLAPAAAAAGAWSTAFYVLGCDGALVLAEGVGVGVLCADDRVRWSPNLAGRVAVTTDSAAATAPAPARARAPAAGAGASGSRAPAARPDSSR